MQFKDIIGQQNVKQNLIKSVKENRIAHAQLFLGPEGCGSLPLAIAYAQYISCLNRIDEDACGTCSSCHKYGKLIHPDLHFVYPVNTSKKISKDPVCDDYVAEWRNCLLNNPYMIESQWYESIEIENKQGFIGTEESKQILKKLNLKSYESDYKILIIWLPEKMNLQAANKLLKMIEEPPENTIILMVSQTTLDILPTILSRVQLVAIPRISDKELKKALNARFQLSPEKIENLVHLSNGNYGKATGMMEQSEETIFFHENFIVLNRASYSGKIADIISFVDVISEIGREQQKRFLMYALQLVRENFILNFKNEDMIYMSAEERNFSEKFHVFINQKNIDEIYKLYNDALKDIEYNGYDKIVFLDLCLRLHYLLKG